MKLFNLNLKRSSNRGPHEPKPTRDWLVLLAGAAAASFLLSALGGYLYLRAEQGELFVVAPPGGSEFKALDMKVLSETLLFYETKAATFEERKSKKPSFSDPSR
jgi:hypothetical protein